MDDGDILRPRLPKPVPECSQESINGSPKDSTEDPNPNPNDFELIPDDVRNESPILTLSCAGSIDLDYVRSLPKSEKQRFCLSRRAEVPSHVAREKLQQFFGDFDEDSVVVLSMMAKCFVAKTIERARSRRIERSQTTSDPISASELLDVSFDASFDASFDRRSTRLGAI